MPARSLLVAALAVAVCMAAPAASAQTDGAAPSETMRLQLGGVTYLHRWSQDGQHEFTPEGQDDLAHWTDMVTLNVHPAVRDGDQLAEVANRVLTNYEGAGQILRTASTPRTDTAPAEHFIAAMLGNPAFLEAAFARLLLVEGRGVVVVYAHRVYGEAAGPAMSTWLAEHGPQTESVLMGWDGAPLAVRSLPSGP